MVVTFLPPAWDIGIVQERAGSPFTCTMQAPHSAIPQPYLVPVSPMVSRNTHSRGAPGSTSTFWPLPLTVNEIMAPPPNDRKLLLPKPLFEILQVGQIKLPGWWGPSGL